MPQLYCQTIYGVFASVSDDPAAHLEALREVRDDPMGHNLYDEITFAGVIQSEEPPNGPLDETPKPLAPWTIDDYKADA